MEDEPAQEAIADESPGEFDSTGTVVLGEHIVPVYVSQTRQCEWGLLDVLRVFTRSTSKSKRFEAFKNAWDKIVSCHNSLWPGVEFKLLKVKFDKSDDSQKSWLGKRTIPTSGLVAFFTYCCTHPKKMLLDKVAAWEGLVRIMACLQLAIGAFSLPFTICGGEGRLPHQLEVDNQGRVAITSFFTKACWRECARDQWQADLRHQGKKWVNMVPTYFDQCKISLTDLLVFVLDPTHTQKFRSQAMPRALEVLTELAFLVDKHARDMCSEIQSFKAGMKRKRTPRSVTELAVKTVAKKVWSGEVAQPCFCLRIFYFFCSCSFLWVETKSSELFYQI